VLMDVQMPVMDGYTATERIRGDARWAHLPVIGMSANAMAEHRERALAAGMNAHLTKPVRPSQLYHALVHWTRGSASSRPSPGPGAIDAVQDRQTGVLDEPQTAFEAPPGDARPAGLPEFDLAVALHNMGGDHRLLRKMLLDFLHDHRQDAVTIREAIAADERSGAQRLLHTLKGVLGTLGATRVADTAQRLEAALGAPLSERPQAYEPHVLTELVCDFEKGFLAFMTGIERWQQQVDAQAAPMAPADPRQADQFPGAGMADPGELAELIALRFRTIERLLRERDPQAAEEVEILLLHPEAKGSPLLVQLMQETAAFDFDAATLTLLRLRD